MVYRPIAISNGWTLPSEWPKCAKRVDIDRMLIAIRRRSWPGMRATQVLPDFGYEAIQTIPTAALIQYFRRSKENGGSPKTTPVKSLQSR